MPKYENFKNYVSFDEENKVFIIVKLIKIC